MYLQGVATDVLTKDMRKKYRELTAGQKSQIFWTIDNEGLEYAILNYLSKDVQGTELESFVSDAANALNALEEKLEELGITEEGVAAFDEENDE